MLVLVFLGEIMHEVPVQELQALLFSEKIRQGTDVIGCNASGCLSVSAQPADSLAMLFDSGIDVILTGDHGLARPASRNLYDNHRTLLRPLNLSQETPGAGTLLVNSQGGPFWFVSLCTGSDRKPVEDPFEGFEQWLADRSPQAPVVVNFHGRDLSAKKSLFWKFSQEKATIHWIGSGIGIQAHEFLVKNGNLFIPDAGTIESLGGINGWAPDLWWEHSRNHVPQTRLPPAHPLKVDGVKIHFDDTFKPLKIDPFSLCSQRKLDIPPETMEKPVRELY